MGGLGTTREGSVGRCAATSVEALTDSTLRVVRRHGLSGVSSRAVAAEAGIALGTVYRHVPDLQNLLVTAAEQVQARFVRALPAAAPFEEELVPAVPRIVAVLVEEARREPRLAELLGLPPGSGPGADGEDVRGWIAERVSASAATGAIAPIDPDMVAAAAYGLIREAFEQVLQRGGAWNDAADVLTPGAGELLRRRRRVSRPRRGPDRAGKSSTSTPARRT